MSNILQAQQSLIDLQERINREIQFGEDSCREMLATISLLKETVSHMETQVTRLFNERGVALTAMLGQPGRPQTVTFAPVDASTGPTAAGD